MKLWALCTVLMVATPLAAAREATYLVKGPVQPQSRAVNGYAQSVVPTGRNHFRVQVATDMGPIGARAETAGPTSERAEGVARGFELPRRLAAALRPDDGPWTRATEVLRWVMRAVRVDADDPSPQDAVSVLARGRGRCSGLANAAVALLRRAGFPARTVSGLLVGNDGVIAHRWLECRLPGAGWVPTDPTLGIWVITPRHLVFSGPVGRIPDVRVEKRSEDGFEGVPTVVGWLERPNVGADLICRAIGKVPRGQVVAELRGPEGEVRRAMLRPEGKFMNLRPGVWHLTVRMGLRVIDRRSLKLESGSVLSFAVPLKTAPEQG